MKLNKLNEIGKWVFVQEGNFIQIEYHKNDNKFILAEKEFISFLNIFSKEDKKSVSIVKNILSKIPDIYLLLIKIVEEFNCFNNDLLKYKTYKILNCITDDETLKILEVNDALEMNIILNKISEDDILLIRNNLYEDDEIDIIYKKVFAISILLDEENFEEIIKCLKLIENSNRMIEILKHYLNESKRLNEKVIYKEIKTILNKI